jgi:nicotinamide-nucleotide amidase
LASALTGTGQKLSVAESCTGGGIAQALTSIPGSSVWFEYGFVTYGNNAKADLLGVPEGQLVAFGAVSKEVAEAMALGALHRSGANIAVAVTGIAGPDGGTTEKPVGTVWFAWATREQGGNSRDGHVVASRKIFIGERYAVREQAVLFALEGALKLLPSS